MQETQRLSTTYCLRTARACGTNAFTNDNFTIARKLLASFSPFGTAVVKLVKAFWLPDAHILETHSQGRKGGWPGLLGQYRGDVTYHGYLPILEGNRDVDELVALITHLHDLLARVILKILAFDGGYNPGVLTYKSAHHLDWVKPHANARTLGYKSD